MIDSPKGTWITKDGNSLRISDMETSHIENILNMIDTMVCKALNKAMSRNEELDIPDYIQDKVHELQEELRNRGTNEN